MTSDKQFAIPIDYVVLKVLEEKALSNPKKYAVLAALEGLAVITGCWEGYGKFQLAEPTPANAMLPVPRWIIDTLGYGWFAHRKTAPSGKTLGETLGIEGGGQGRKPAKDHWNQYFRDLRLARDVFLERKTCNYEDAIANVADRHDGVRERTVKRAWSEHGAAIEAAASSYDTTS